LLLQLFGTTMISCKTKTFTDWQIFLVQNVVKMIQKSIQMKTPPIGIQTLKSSVYQS